MTRKHANRAIIVLESPWELDKNDANRSSVLPFIEGVAKLAGDMDVLYANFYDESSLLKAGARLAKSRYANAIVYVAAHGGDGEVGNVELLSIFAAVSVMAEECNITGVLIGSCYGGQCSTTLEKGIRGSKLRWCAGYASSARWLPGTLVDCAILESMVDLPRSAYKNGAKMVARLGAAVSLFSTGFRMGEDEDDNPVSLGDSLQFVIQPEGQGHNARNVSAEVFDQYVLHQLDEDDEDDE
jgi:hypothetical protein